MGPMTLVLFIDTNIPIYAVGREHRYKQFCIRIMDAVASNRQAFMTGSEVLQEIVHFYTSGRRWSLGQTILGRFAETMRGCIEPVYAEDVLLAGALVDQYLELGSRDLIHVAVMRRLGLTRIISADTHFDRVDGIERLDPVRLDEWEHSILDN